MSDTRGYHDCSLESLEAVLETNVKNGVTNMNATMKFERDGPNELYKPRPPTLFMLFVAQLVNVIMILLIVSACASLTIAATGSKSNDAFSYVEGIAIFIIVGLNASIAAFTENVANNALEALSKMSQNNCNVIREGKEMVIPSTQVVVGDLVVLQIGDIAPADIRLTQSTELKVNEMLLTGEPDDVPKSHNIPKNSSGGGEEEKLTPMSMCFSSCLVTNGKGIGIVTDIGMQTRVGAIAAMLNEGTAKKKTCFCVEDVTGNMTPLQVSLQELGLKIGYMAIAVCVGVWIVGTILERKDESDHSKPSWLYMTLVAVTLAVAAIPEGIPLCVTISLSTGANEMVKRNVLVRRLAAVETLGSASVICTDKTGTLTEGKMTMVKMYSAGQLYDLTHSGFDPHVGKVFPSQDVLPPPIMDYSPQDEIGKKSSKQRKSSKKRSGSSSLKKGASQQQVLKEAGSSASNGGSQQAGGSSYRRQDSTVTILTSSSGANIEGVVSETSRDSFIVRPSLPVETGNIDSGMTEPTVRSTLCAGLLCCNTTISKDPDSGLWKPKGNSSEAPIVVAAAKIGFWEENLIGKEFERILEIPFNSSRKMMVTISRIVSGSETSKTMTFGKGGVILPPGTQYIVVVKGAPNIVCETCKDTTNRSGEKVPYTKTELAKTMGVVDLLSDKALRVLAIAIRCLPTLPFDPEDNSLSSDYKFAELVKGAAGIRFLGLVASIDPAREGVKEAVEGANVGSIRVVMITGDYRKTAIAIARNINILLDQDDEETAALDCAMLRSENPNTGLPEYLSETELDSLTCKVKVFARAKPEDKLEIVKSLQRQGLVCAMTGDGVNDAPALKRSDIGVAMGIQGTDVAKGAADMILTDDNFVSIVGAVEKGRVIYAGIQKFVAFIMSVHIGEVMQIFFCVVAGIPIMRKPLQILFLILVTDLPPAVALGMEPGSKEIMNEVPRPKTQPIVLRWMWYSIFMNGFILSLVIAVVYIISLAHYCEVDTLLGNSEDLATLIKMQDNFIHCAEQDSNCDNTLYRSATTQVASYTDPFLICAQLENSVVKNVNLVTSTNQELLANRTWNTGEWDVDACNDDQDKASMQVKLRKARTATFIAVVFAENVRAYTSRSWDKPFYVNLCSNIYMQKAILVAQIALWLVVFLPGVSDQIFELDGRRAGVDGIILAVAALLGSLILCELYKLIVKTQIVTQKERLKREQAAYELQRKALVEKKVSLVVDIEFKPKTMI